MGSDFRSITLEEGLSALIDYRGKSPPKSVTGTPVISAKVVKGGRILRPIEQTIDPSYYKTWMRRGLPQSGDIILTTEGPLGEVAQLDTETSQFAVAQRVVVLRGKPGILDNTFLKYLLMSRSQQEVLASYGTGTTVEGISQKALRSVTIRVPRYDQQRAIALILGTLDDKIDLSRRINETLEAMARALFRSWFVDFDPVCAKAEGRGSGLSKPFNDLFPIALVVSELGEIPIGWEARSIYEIADVVYGAPFTSALFNTEGRGEPLVRIRDLADERPGVWTSEVLPKGYKIRPGSVIVSMDGEFRAYLWGGDEAWLNQRVCAFVPKNGHSAAFVRNSIIGPLADVEATETGTTVIHIGKNDIDRFLVVVPSQAVLAAFNRVCQPWYDRIVAAKRESRILASLRDTLLPKLISGELRIKDAEAFAARSA